MQYRWTVFLEIQLATYGRHFSPSSEITNSGPVLATQLTMETIFTMSNVISAPYVLFNVQTVFTNEQVINLGFTSVFTDFPLRHFANIAAVVNDNVFNRNGRQGNRSLTITNSVAVPPTMQLKIEAIVTMPNINSAPCVLSNVPRVSTHEQVTRYSESTSVIIEIQLRHLMVTIQLRHLMVTISENVLNRIRRRGNRSLETDANNIETVFSESQITRYGGNTTAFWPLQK